MAGSAPVYDLNDPNDPNWEPPDSGGKPAGPAGSAPVYDLNDPNDPNWEPPDVYGFAETAEEFDDAVRKSTYAEEIVAEAAAKAAKTLNDLTDALEKGIDPLSRLPKTQTARKNSGELTEDEKEDLQKRLDKWDAVGGAANHVGGLAKNSADNDAMGAFDKVVGGVSKSLAMLGPEGLVAGKALEAAGAAVNKFVEVVDALNRRAAELAKYNGDLASSQAQRLLRELESDIKEAETLGKSLSNVDELSSDIGATIREGMLPFKRILTDIVGGILEFAKPFIEIMTGAANLFGQAYDWAKPIFSDMFKAMMHIIESIGNIFKSQKTIQEEKDAKQYKDEMQRMGFWGGLNEAAGRERGAGMFAPAGAGGDF